MIPEQNNKRVYAVDTETFYSKEVSVTKMDVWMYCRHPEFECYMVTVCGEDGFEYVGPPSGLDWSRISGPGTMWVAHNAQFDRPVIEWMREVGQIPADAAPEEWACSADLCCWAGLPRALAGAAEQLLKIKPDKTIRDRMVGKRYSELDAGAQMELMNYAMEDARVCLKLWQTLSAGHPLTEGKPYPDLERRLSVFTGEMGQHGVPVDVDALDKGITHLGDLIWQAERDIPWADGVNPVLSPKQLALECAKVGLVPPKSLAKDDAACAEWEDQFGEQYPWVAAMRVWRRCNALKAKLESMRARVKPCGRMVYGLKSFGGHTGRYSGAGGVNLQNLTKGDLFGVNMRGMIKAAAGNTLIIADLSQIEPRCCRAGTLVKTDSGYKHIEDVTRVDKLYDGVVWCRHDGVIQKENKKCVAINGEFFTEDHKILTETGWAEARSVVDAGTANSAWVQRASTWKDVWELGRFVGTYSARVLLQVLGKVLGMRSHLPGPTKRPEEWEERPMPEMWQEEDGPNKASGATGARPRRAGHPFDGAEALHTAEMWEPGTPELQCLWSPRNPDGRRVSERREGLVRLHAQPARSVPTPNHRQD